MRVILLVLTTAVSTASASDKSDEEKWDVNSPPGEAATVAIDTRTGTWMSVDVSPDGTTLVFDLLGDLYTLPIEGGEAKPLTHSIAWEMQPRFSPDGASLVYMSDAGGGDNAWIMDADGSHPRAVTDEDFRLVNNPVWHPDGDYVAVRKHFTGTRSLGTGEIWLYHSSGGKGVPLNEKPNWQKDLGEPAFSPDGRYVYFSQDTTAGRLFEYAQNSHGQIYVIQRLDLTDGEIEAFVTGPGGAVRPVPSPDGRWLAFVRRLGGQSTLFLKDLRTGEERPVWDGLERDLQEIWAVHGVYPAFAWMPGAGEIVAWAQGRLWADRRPRRRGPGDSFSRQGHAGGPPGHPLRGPGGPGHLRREAAPLGHGLPPGRRGRLLRPRVLVRQGPARGHTPAPGRRRRPLRVLPELLSRWRKGPFRDLERRDPGERADDRVAHGSRDRPDEGAGEVPRAALLAGRQDRRL